MSMGADTFVVGCVQVNPSDDRQVGIEQAEKAVRTAVNRGASLVVLPEYVTFLHASGNVMRSNALREEDDPALSRFRLLAKQEKVWLLVGSLALATDGGKLVNRSFLISASGIVVSRYDKIHMFDATLPGGRTIRESSSYEPGTNAVVADTPWAKLGMSICYDVRFPALYRALAQSGAHILLVPAAFTKATGELHWKALLQARAIENGAYVVAAATCGTHPGGHQTYGHAMIIDPNGKVIAEAGDEPEVIYATINVSEVESVRTRMPSLKHDRAFEMQPSPNNEEQHGPF
jgi:deaminated glutathione amidase